MSLVAGNGMMARREEKWNTKIAGIADEIEWIVHAHDHLGLLQVLIACNSGCPVAFVNFRYELRDEDVEKSVIGETLH